MEKVSPTASDLLQRCLKGKDTRVIAIDPGQTTGICLFNGSQLVDQRQLATGLMPHAAGVVRDYIHFHHTQKPLDSVVVEDYRIYSWRTDEHAWQSVHTLRLIGALEWILHEFGVPLVKQSAQQAKGFCTDDKLKAWGLYAEGLRHARDAVRHACYYLLFRVAQIQGAGKKAPFEID